MVPLSEPNYDNPLSVLLGGRSSFCDDAQEKRQSKFFLEAFLTQNSSHIQLNIPHHNSRDSSNYFENPSPRRPCVVYVALSRSLVTNNPAVLKFAKTSIEVAD